MSPCQKLQLHPLAKNTERQEAKVQSTAAENKNCDIRILTSNLDKDLVHRPNQIPHPAFTEVKPSHSLVLTVNKGGSFHWRYRGQTKWKLMGAFLNYLAWTWGSA